MKKLMVGLVLACFLAVGVLPEKVQADVVVEIDYNDAFLKKHRKECSEIPRVFLVNSPEGYLKVYKSPETAGSKTKVKNGDRIQGIWQYVDEDGEEWYGIRSEEAYDEIMGWVKTSECFTVPDNIAFCEKYQDEFVEFDTAYQDAFQGVSSITLWSYPCSGVIEAENMEPEYLTEFENLGDVFGNCWKDPEGRLWGYISYFYGIRNTWVCLDEPAATDIEADERVLPLAPEVCYTGKNAKERNAAEEDAAKEDTPGERQNTDIALVTVGAVFVVTAVTIVLLVFFFGGQNKKNRKNEESGQ